MDLLRILKARRRNLLKRIDQEKNKFAALRHKSNHVRRTSSLPARIGWFTDRLGELELVISLIEGRIEPKDFKKHLAGDELDQLLTGL